MEDMLSPQLAAAPHLLQHTLRGLCIDGSRRWLYAVFWRILPRNFPPPQWDLQGGGAVDRSRRSWILAWEDGFCDFAPRRNSLAGLPAAGLQPELFFKMSHEIYSYGEGMIGKVAADNSHRWVFKPQDQEAQNLRSQWQNPAYSHPRVWEAHFQTGIQTIALIAVRGGVVQLGALTKVMEDLSYVVLLRKKFIYLESIPGVFLPHPLSTAAPLIKVVDGNNPSENRPATSFEAHSAAPAPLPPAELLHLGRRGRITFTPSPSSLEALLSALPSVGPSPASPPAMAYIGTRVSFPPPRGPPVAAETGGVAETDFGEAYAGCEGDMAEAGLGGDYVPTYYAGHAGEGGHGY